MAKLTKKQQELYSYLEKFFNENDRMPTMKEIKFEFNLIGHGHINRKLERLVDIGKLKRIAPHTINYRLVNENNN